MSGLAALLAGHTPVDIYRWRGALPVEDVQHAVEHAGWTFRYLDGWTVEEQDPFLEELGAALGLDRTPGDLDELAAALSGLAADGEVDGEVDGGGTVLLWDGWSPLARHDARTFDAAVAALASRARDRDASRFAVVLRGDGPDLDLEELPHKQ